MSDSNATQLDAGGEAAVRRHKTLIGTVRSTKMQKTISVDVERLERHRKYHKYVRRRTTYYAHDENGIAREGDQVRIEETRPLSKLKRWRLIGIVQRAKSNLGEVAEAAGGSS
jgi:small subunit ribosomal protein S17